ncbi:hypothetical protein LTR37_013527 [Vermiconidia calcicola]|uniref:Uncharacterized protein n=1 Tax=Vermiconidia calcicola TaxID=1690605 RepID=A0ACC3MWU5_9PEZI|nr:hypothetical protein LTR37_013527 [Vermiconidia calcicola]
MDRPLPAFHVSKRASGGKNKSHASAGSSAGGIDEEMTGIKTASLEKQTEEMPNLMSKLSVSPSQMPGAGVSAPKKHTNLKSAREEIKKLKSQLAIKDEFVQLSKERVAVQDERFAVLDGLQKAFSELKTTTGLTAGKGDQDSALTASLVGNQDGLNEMKAAVLQRNEGGMLSREEIDHILEIPNSNS